MQESSFVMGNHTVRTYTLDTVVVGTGAAGFNAADRLFFERQTDIAIVTEHVNAGTSRNTGSDKQTYYKLTLSGDTPDSVREMAQTLFEGNCVDGDIALAEAALSTKCFLKLVDLGVPFPCNRYGEYIGYKTDHDPRTRATSVGPYTSKMMTECLEKAVDAKGIKIFNKMQVVKILAQDGVAHGLLCLDLAAQAQGETSFVAFHCNHIIYATGGPAGMYADSVFPFGQYGATGVAFEAGVTGKNLTEWQYGLASVKPRWNVSGTYMQVLPRFISTDENGENEHEFLMDFFADKGDMLTKVFLKGYQWPFDVRKVDGGSSIVDILVYLESCKGRRVFLDFRENAMQQEVDYKTLSPEAFEYLEKAGACFGTPYERLCHMNMPAVSFYKERGVDLAVEPLEIALCAQHNNGGLGIDAWWQTNLKNFFAVGEVAASHGVYRPGGSALNAGQVGSTRAAQYVANANTEMLLSQESFEQLAKTKLEDTWHLAQKAMTKEASNVKEYWDSATKRMSQVGAAIRDKSIIADTVAKIEQELQDFENLVHTDKVQEISKIYRLKDILLCQYVYLQAMLDYVQAGSNSRGSALYTDENGTKPYASLPDTFIFCLDDGTHNALVQEVTYEEGACNFAWRGVRPIPEDDDFFENVWRQYRENKNIF